MKPWQRALLFVGCLAALYALWRFPLGGVTTLLIGAGAAWLGRSVYRSKLASNPLGENRDFSLRPGTTAIVKSVGSFAAAMFWAFLGGTAVRLKYIPDTRLGALVVVGPILALLGVGAIYLFTAMAKFMFGSKPPQAGSQ